MIYLSHLSVARCHGPDAGTFLHGQLSADITSLEPGESTFACYCNIRGQVIALLLVHRESSQGEGSFLIAGSSALLNAAISKLRMYVMRSRLEFDSATGLQPIGAWTGQSEPRALQLASMPFGSYLAVDGSTQGANSSNDLSSWWAAELKHGVSWLDEATSQHYLPQMLGAEAIGALSFSKGCYPGQEIVARARYLGKVKRKPLLITAPDAPTLPTGSKLQLQSEDSAPAGAATAGAVVIGQATGTNGHSIIRVVTSFTGESPLITAEADGRAFAASVLESPAGQR